MFSAKDAQTIARAAQRRGSLAYRQNLRRKNGGQSLIVAIIVLFILLFLGGVFIALIANNLRNTRRGVQVSAANKFAEAGIKYLDQQLMTSPEGADWRPVPESLPSRDPADYDGPDDDPTIDDNNNGIVNGTVGPNDPDYRRLKFYNPATGEGGYTRVNFGGPTASQSNLGGRALVRVSYSPYRNIIDNRGVSVYWDDLNGNGTFDDPAERVVPENADRTRRYIKLESVGRVGIIDSLDPTTYRNTEGEGLRRELVAYKALGLTESLRFITDKDKRRTSATLGAPYPVTDRGQPRYIYNVYQGAIRSNTDLTFYGMNYLSLDPRRGDALEVAGTLGLNGLSPNLATPTGADPTKVYITDGLPVGPTRLIPVSTLGATQTGNLLPSGSGTFTTLNGLIRDNPRGNETQDLDADAGNSNLRAVSRLEPPLMDAATGDSGLTRYRALTRDSAPLAAFHTGANPIGIGRDYAGAYGWGQNLYIPNAVDLPAFSESASNVSSQRTEWLNPRQASGLSPNWKTEGMYTPPAVTITLSPRYIALTQTSNAGGRTRQYLRNPTNGAGITQPTVYRYTYEPGGALTNAPTLGIDDGDGNAATAPDGPGGSPDNNSAAAKFAGYPAVKVNAGYYDGDFIIFAEGNVRIKGTVGGYDPETGQTFVRRLTVVTNGTVYFDGSLLRDNISPEMTAGNAVRAAAKGKSTIAVLAKNYAAVNTTQFLTTSLSTDGLKDFQSNSVGEQYVVQLRGDRTSAERRQDYDLNFGPVLSYDGNNLPIVANVYNAAAGVDLNQIPAYLTTANSLSFLLRHARDGKEQPAAINLFVNTFLDNRFTPPGISPNAFEGWGNLTGARDVLVVGDTPEENFYNDKVFRLNPALPDPSANYLFPTNGFPYLASGAGTTANMPSIGITNKLALSYDQTGAGTAPYKLSRFGVVPLDIRIEALIYAQEGSFFIIPGPWFNPNPSDTYAQYISPDPATGAPRNHRAEQPKPSASPTAPEPVFVDPEFPYYGEPLDIRITMFGAITENLPAEIGDQGAWLQKWGWVPRFRGSTGLDSFSAGTIPTFHGSVNAAGVYQTGGVNDGVGNGITYIYDPRLSSPYDAAGIPLRINPNFIGLTNATQAEPLPPMPRLPVAPGLLYYGERPIR